jgi:hypothetical protein
MLEIGEKGLEDCLGEVIKGRRGKERIARGEEDGSTQQRVRERETERQRF